MGENRLQLCAQSPHAALVLEMSRRGDRFGMQVRVAQGAKLTTLLRSVEGDSMDPWPPSGPLQEVVPGSDGGRDYLAGIGQAGSSHWSLIVTTMPTPLGLEFEFACRVKGARGWLGSTFDLPDGLTGTRHGDRVVLERDRITLACQADTSCDVKMVDRQLRMSAQTGFDTDRPRTIRWKYRFSV